MDNDKAFLKAIAAAPDDDALRFVYADWLEERGDPRAEFLRFACDTEVNWPAATVARLEALEEAIEPKWIAAAMAGWPVLKYHRRTFALLGEKLVLSKANLRKIERWEARVGMRLPASLREWYSLEGSEHRLNNDSEGFRTFPLQQSLNNTAREVQELPVGGHGHFSIGGLWEYDDCHIALDTTHDPAVISDTCGSDTFSEFVLLRVWARITHSAQDGYWAVGASSCPEPDLGFPSLHADDPAFGPRDIAYLKDRFAEVAHRFVAGRWSERPNPFVPGETLRFFNPTSVLRFFVPGVRVQIVCQGNPQKRTKEAYWDISADTPKQLEEVVAQHLWGHRTLSQTLTAPTKAGKRVLAALRRKSVRKE